MKRLLALVAVLLALPLTASAQETASVEEAPEFAVGVHGNTGSPPMLGVSYFLSDDIALRGSAGFFPETGGYDVATSDSGPRRVTYDTRWYGGALAGLYYLPSLWRVQPYAGLKAQYVRAHSESSMGRDQAFDRIDAGALAGVELRVFSWLRLSGEIGAGYRAGLDRNSAIVPATVPLESSEFGLMHSGLGLQVRIP